MRLQARKPIKIRNKVLGGIKTLLCVPIVSENTPDMEKEARGIKELNPDIIEWRVDFFKENNKSKKVKEALKLLRSVVKEIPLIFTFRSHLEGGKTQIEDKIRINIIEDIISTGEIDIVDIELISGRAAVNRVKTTANNNNIPIIISYHNFIETPSIDSMLNKIKEEVSNGANIAKLAVMAKSEEDILDLLTVTLTARREMYDIPIITMSMGEIGRITRIVGEMFGSDLTFGSYEDVSAPGQIPIKRLRESMKAIQY